MPCALPYCNKEPERLNELPWILRFRMKVERAGVSVDHYIPLPVGYLPVLIVFLITKFSSEFSYPTGNKCQYRNYITLAYKTKWRVYIIDNHPYISSSGTSVGSKFTATYVGMVVE